MKWVTIKDLPEESLSELWEFLKDIKNNLEVDAPLKSISIPLFSKTCSSPTQKDWIRAFRKKILKQLEKREKVLKRLKETKKDADFAYVKLNIKKFNSFYEKVEKEIEKLSLIKRPREELKSNLLITRNKSGDFCYRGKLINFQNEDTIYYKVFVALFEKNHVNGFYSYKEIDKFLTQNGEKKLGNIDKAAKRITNAVVSLFRFTKNFQNKAPDGKRIIAVKKGKGLTFYNPLT